MILTLFDQNKVFNLVLPEKVSGKYILNTVDDDEKEIELMAIEEENEKWYIRSNKLAYLKDLTNQIISKVELEPAKVYTINKRNGSTALLYVQVPTEDRNEFTKHYVVGNTIKIGRGVESQICFTNKLVSNCHCVITYDSNGNGILRDNNSSNGTYVNGNRIKEKVLCTGDVIYIMGFKIVYNGRLLSLNNPDQSVFLDKKSFQPFYIQEPEISEEEELDDFGGDQENPNIFYRSPRFKRDIEKKEITIDSPPTPPSQDETPVIFLLGPSITMGMTSMLTAFITVQNTLSSGGNIKQALPTLLISFSMLIGTVLWPILTKRYEKKRKIEREKVRQEKYKQYLVEVRENIIKECEIQSEILHENHVTIDECTSRVRNRKRNLWERVSGQNDFLKIRLGIGDLPLNAEIKYPPKKFTLDDDNLQEELYKLAEEPKILKSVPVTLSLVEEKVSGIIGNRKKVNDFVKGLIVQLTSLHSYDELKLIFIYDKHEQEVWEFAKWLPHVWSEEKDVRFIASDEDEVKELSAYFEKELANRNELPDNELSEITPHYVVLSMSKILAARAEIIRSILKEKKDLGFSVITMYDELKSLPKECNTVVELGNISKIYDKDDIAGNYIAFKPDIYIGDECNELAVQLANIQLDTSVKAYTLPTMLTFLEMFGVGKIEHLNALTRWKDNDPTKTLQTQIGVDTMGQAFNLDLHEKYHGPHGLIAGMTGSGKSEFIMTFILSLAVNYHPDEVAFILIDYKGGGMANAFLDLPHVAGTITNLDGAAVKRSLVSIQSELKRRQAIFSETSKLMNESNIDIYKYQKLYRDGKVSEPLQHLFMISDEFAELKTQQPEFMEQLVSAARIGRSLGVHLILATQKPSGVVDDQIWSNSKFRISLKVQEKADSMEVIKRPDAAELSITGRFYLQVGFNELFEMGQSAWGGAPYHPSDRVETKKDENIVVIDNLGRVIKDIKIDRKKQTVQNPPKQLDEVTKYLSNLAREENIKVKPLWLEPIPEFIYIDELKKKYNINEPEKFVLNPVIGEVDDPENQAQHVMTLPISAEGNTVVYGVAGAGKTTFITSMLYSIMRDNTPEEVNMYLLDFGSETLRAFAKAPHIGDVLLSYESEKIDNLFKMLYKEIEARKKLFSEYGGDYNSYIKSSGKTLQSMLIVIHNYAAFSETYEEKEDAINFLTREGLKYGIYFVVTALNTNAVRYRTLQNFKQLLVLQLNDDTEYSSVLGNTGGVFPSKIKGRGIFKTETIYEFQTAHIFKDVDNTLNMIREYCNDYSNRWKQPMAKKIPILPKKVDVDFLADEIKYCTNGITPIGVEKNSLNTSYYDFDKCISLVLSQSNDNSDFAQALSEVLAKKGDGEVTVLDAKDIFNKDEAKGYKYVSDDSELDRIIGEEILNILVKRNNTVKDAKEAGTEIPKYNKLIYVINSFSDLLYKLSDNSKQMLNLYLEKNEEEYGVKFIIVDTDSSVSSISFEPWFSKHVSLNDGIWIGEGIASQYQLKVSKITSDMYDDIGDNFGYIVNNGKTKLIKMVSSVTKVMEDDE